MPTIIFSLKDLQNLVGKKLTIEEVQELAHYGKGDLEGYDKETDEVKIEFGDTNLPYLWSAEGFARLIKGLLGKRKGIPKLEINSSDYRLIVDKSVDNIRPFVTAFVAKGSKINDYLIKQIIQLQEKLCESYGRRRQKIAIGVYQLKKIKFPVYYKATEPESVKFIPLDFRKEMTQQEILEEHPKGREYSWILKDSKKYPILMDSKNNVLSFPPIINSDTTGKIEENDTELFFEATGIDLNALLLATNIFAQALYERGFSIYSAEINYPNRKIITPKPFNESIKITKEQVSELLGLKLSDKEIKHLLERLQYNYANGIVKIPPYRKDIMHPYDVIEDISISYGYNKIPENQLKSYTTGNTKPLIKFIDKIREIMIGLGYQEIMSAVLTNKDILYKNMNINDFGAVEIENYTSESYSVVRSWLLPIVMDFLSKNTHVEYPQKVFEQGLVAARKDETINEYERITIATAHEKAGFTEIKQVLDYILTSLNLSYEIQDVEHNSFIPGRVGRVLVNGKNIAFIGELSPQVLSNLSLEVPVAALELNLSELFEVTQ